MNCDEAQKLLTAATDRELGPDQAGAVEAHVQSCDRCGAEITRIRMISTQAQGSPEAMPLGLRNRILGDRPKRSPLPRLVVSGATLLILVAVLAMTLTPSAAMAKYRQMWSSLVEVRTAHMVTWSPNSKTGDLDRGDTWIAYGALRREGLRGMRGLRGANGRADYDSQRGVYLFIWSPEKGAYVPNGAKVELPADPVPNLDSGAPRLASDMVKSAMQGFSIKESPDKVTSAQVEFQGRKVVELTTETKEKRREERGTVTVELPTRSKILLDPETNLPIRTSMWTFRDSEWKPMGHTDWKFNMELPKEMFTIESLQKAYANIGQPSP